MTGDHTNMKTGESSSALTCLWLDLKTSIQVDETPAMVARHCEVTRSTGFDEAAVADLNPDFVVLEFDYPSRQDLSRARTFKQTFSSLPMVVVTTQHSEALAVWFFRSRFYDYLVQPLAASEVAACLSHLKEIAPFRASQEARRAARSSASLPKEASYATNPRTMLQPALTLVERNYHQRLTVTDAAEQCGLAPFRFGREFKEQFGMDFREYVLRFRVREACRLLRNPRVSITEVGYSVGFSEPSYFTKMFKRLVGICPSQALGADEIDLQLDQVPGPRSGGETTRGRQRSHNGDAA